MAVKQKSVRAGWPAPVQDEILATLRAGPPLGMTLHEIRAAMGRTGAQLEQTMSQMLSAGRLWVTYAKPRSRYYPTAEAMEAAKQIVEAEEAAIRNATRVAARERARVARLERNRAERAARPPKVTAAKPADVPAKAHCWKRVPVVASANEMPVLVKSVAPRKNAKAPAGPPEVVGLETAPRTEAVQYPDHRYVVDPAHRGEFSALGPGRYLEVQS